MSKWMLPIQTEWMTEQMLHEPSRSYGEEIYNICKGFTYSEALEIGTAWGISTLCILLANEACRLTSVDSSDGTAAPAEVEKNNLKERWDFRVQKSDDFFSGNSNTYDLIYIDGSHLYENVKPDLFNSYEVLRSGGVMFWDDFTHPANITVDKNGKFAEYGVSLATCELFKEKKIEKIFTTTRLIGFIKP